MRRTVCFLAALLLAACGQTTPEMRVVNDAAQALGGRDRVLAVQSLSIQGAGQNFNLGQNRSPEGDLPELQITEYRRVIDYAGGRWRQEQTRTPQYLTGNPAPQRQIAGLDGDVAYNVAASGDAVRLDDSVAADRRLEIEMTPIGAIRAALSEGATLSNARQHDGHAVVDITTSAGRTLTLAIDATTKLPVSVTSMSAHPNLGDVAIEAAFSDYQDVDGLKLPATTTSRIDRYVVARITATSQELAADTGQLAAPDAARASAVPSPAANVTVEQVATGVWYLAGQSHHSVAVEFADHLVLIEAPQQETRTLAVIRKARELTPGKPVTHLVATHHHFDHSGGVRAAISEGLTVVAHKAAESFFKEIASRPFTRTPDALAKNPKPLVFQAVDGELVMRDATRTLALYPIADSPHADTLLMGYLPNERLLVQADVYSPPAPTATTMPRFPFAANLVANVNNRKLRIERVVPIHGRVVPFKDLMAAVGGTT